MLIDTTQNLLQPDRKITPQAFRNRFTFMEKAKIELASVDVPTDPQEKRLQAAGLRASLRDVDNAPTVNLDSPGLRSRLQILADLNLLDSPNRIDEILNNPIQPEERL